MLSDVLGFIQLMEEFDCEFNSNVGVIGYFYFYVNYYFYGILGLMSL